MPRSRGGVATDRHARSYMRRTNKQKKSHFMWAFKVCLSVGEKRGLSPIIPT